MSSQFMELLEGSQTLIVKQKKELMEIVIDFESKNNYEILNQNSEVVGYISEASKGFWSTIGRLVFRSHRNFEAIISDKTGQKVFQLKRPFYFIWSDLYLYDGEKGSFLGSVHRKFSLFFKKYEVKDPKENLVATLKSFMFRIWTFPIKDHSGREAGKITKKWGGVLKEIFTDADTFAVDYTSYPWSKEHKSLLLATAVSIDFDYFEENEGNGGGIFDIFGD